MEESKNKINLGGVSNKDIREELETAINQATKHYDDFMNQNQTYQEKIIQLKNKNEPHFDKQGDLAMNEHKYLNTLAHVHQIREDLKVTQDRYN